MYMINIIDSAGYMDGRESQPVFDRTRQSVINRAYERYRKLYEEAKADGSLEYSGEPMLTPYDFGSQMMAGFFDSNCYVVLQLADHHIQFESVMEDIADNGSAQKKCTQIQKRWLPVLGFNTKQWWIYDEKDGCYIDPPAAVLTELNGLDNSDLMEERLYEICESDPGWLFDEPHRYYDEDMDI